MNTPEENQHLIYLDDLTEGQAFELGQVKITKEKIITFAKDYDPQVFHLDEKIATEMCGGLIASGWQTASLCNRLLVDGFMGKAAVLPSPGVEKLDFIKPAFAGDTLQGRVTILNTRVSESKPDRGLVNLRAEMLNAKGVMVFRMCGSILLRCKPKS